MNNYFNLKKMLLKGETEKECEVSKEKSFLYNRNRIGSMYVYI